MRVRGLKQNQTYYLVEVNLVAPHAGAWIETVKYWIPSYPVPVAPHAGAWIETSVKRRQALAI